MTLKKINKPLASLWIFPAKIFIIFAVYVIFFQIQRGLFFLCFQSMDPSEVSLWGASLHGLAMDCAVAGYFTVIPFIMTLSSLILNSKIPVICLNIYFIISSLFIAICLVADPLLYSYWHTRLDATPLFFFTSSPSAAIASASYLELFGGIFGILIVSAIIFFVFYVILHIIPLQKIRRPTPLTGVSLFIGAFLFISIRGGVTVSTMNLSHAYFSDNAFLNHTAINPLFSLFYTLAHQNDFNKNQYFTEERLAEILDSLNKPVFAQTQDSVPKLLNLSTHRPDVFIIILESFSNGLFPSLGGENIASGLDSIAKESVVFENFYAVGLRTDRGIPAILSGFPGGPEISIMKYVNKAANLGSIASELKKYGNYNSVYYYGGDADFTNMKAYIFNTGYNRLISDKDFPIKDKISKWGAHDDKLFERVLKDYKKINSSDAPQFFTIQSSSSHEPFNVPFDNPKFKNNKKANAFSFTDNVATNFINNLQKTERGKTALIIIVADHWGAYPESVMYADIFTKHKVPLIITGGGIKEKHTIISRPSSQTDIPATLLGLLGIPHANFPFSKNVADPSVASYAWMYNNDEIALATAFNLSSYNIESGKNVYGEDTDTVKAIQQLIYKVLSTL